MLTAQKVLVVPPDSSWLPVNEGRTYQVRATYMNNNMQSGRSNQNRIMSLQTRPALYLEANSIELLH